MSKPRVCSSNGCTDDSKKLKMSMTNFEIQKLDGSNFILWKLKIQAMLIKDSCALALKGATAKPTAMPVED